MHDNYFNYFLYVLTGLVLGLLLTTFSPLLVLLGFLGLWGLLVIFFNIEIGVTLIAVAAIIPVARQIGPVIVPLVDLVMLVTLISWLLRTLLYKEKFVLPSVDIASTVLLMAMVASFFVSGDKAGTLKEIIQYMVFAFLYTTMLFNNIKNTQHVDLIMNILTIGTALLGGYAFIRFLQIGQAGLYILGLHKNALGGLLVLPLPYLYMKFMTSGKKHWLLFVILNTLGLMASLSRGAWFGGFTGTLVVSLLLGKKVFFRYILVILAGALLFIFLLPAGFRSAATSQHTLSERGTYWSIAIAAFQERPILGWGFANFHEASKKFIGNRPSYLVSYDPHNVFLRFASEMGIVGLSAFIFFILFIFIKTLQAIPKQSVLESKLLIIGLIGSITAYFSHGVFDVFWVRGTGSLFWIFLSLIFVLIEKKELIHNVQSKSQ
ncbi:MAG: O-antigen ligase family protein [Candidatus Margulisbacteria bacterium]|nr:O-antigen ligase family protein [Candidatus Margulisiibacteriota bacterium]